MDVQGGVITKEMVSAAAQAVPPAVTVKRTLAWVKSVPTVPEPMAPVVDPATVKAVGLVKVRVMVSWMELEVPIRPVI